MCLASGAAVADGYNTWPGALVAWGDLEVSPQWQVALPHRDNSTMLWMLQGGLAQGFDLGLSLEAELGPNGASLRPMSVVPRFALGEAATWGLGLGWTLSSDGFASPLILPTLTWAWDPGGDWRGDANLFASVPLHANIQVTVEAAVHVERHLAPMVSALLEVDLQVAELPDHSATTAIVYAGLFVRPRRCDMIALALGVPVSGNGGDRRPLVGAWWNHVVDLGFGERNCRR